MILGIDPSTAAIGLGLVRPGPCLREMVVEARVVRVGEDLEAALDQAIAIIRTWQADHGISALVVEQYGRGGHGGIAASVQAAKGPTWVGGLLAGELRRELGMPLWCTSAEWRPSMQAAAAREGLLLPGPDDAPQLAEVPRLPPAGVSAPARILPPRVELLTGEEQVGALPGSRAFVYACGCRVVQEVQKAAPACPRCALRPRAALVPAPAPGAATSPPRRRDGEARSRHWKQQAWRFLVHARPDLAQALYDDARSRARTLTEAWRLAGVADACEAVGIAMHGVVAGSAALVADHRRGCAR